MSRRLLITGLIILSCSAAIVPTVSAEDMDGAQLPPYPMNESIPFQGPILTNGVPADAMVMMTGDPIKKVMEYYRQAMESRGHTVVHHMFSPESGYVGFFDLKSGTMRMATAVSRPDGGTMIVISAMDPRPLVEEPAGIPSDLPSLPEAQNIVTTESQQHSVRQRSVGFELPRIRPKEAKKRLLDKALELGWRAASPKQPFGTYDLFLTRGTERCLVKIRALPSGEGGSVSTSVTMVVFEQ